MEEQEVVQDLMVIERGLYEFLRDKASKMIMLEDHGVDNWEGYEEAMSAYRGLIQPDPQQGELELAGAVMETAKYDDA